jgi:hypothetical protein
MSDQIMQSQVSNIELSDDELEGVAGGVALSLADANGVAFGDHFSATANSTKTTAISVPHFNLAAGESNSASIAG